MTVVLVRPQWSISRIDRHPLSVPDAPEARERMIAQYTIYKYGTHVELRSLLGYSTQGLGQAGRETVRYNAGPVENCPLGCNIKNDGHPFQFEEPAMGSPKKSC